MNGVFVDENQTRKKKFRKSIANFLKALFKTRLKNPGRLLIFYNLSAPFQAEILALKHFFHDEEKIFGKSVS